LEKLAQKTTVFWLPNITLGVNYLIFAAKVLKKSKINSVRAGGIVGKHQVIFGFKYLIIRLIHESISREAFGNGVIFVAQNLINKKQGYYVYDDILKPYLKQK